MWGRLKTFFRSWITAGIRNVVELFVWQNNPMDQVFRNDLLREMIVGHVIQNEIQRNSSRDDLRSVRLVSESWLQDANRYLRKSGQPLYQLHLTRHNSLTSSDEVRWNGGKLLDRFTRAMTSPTRLETKIPPVSLKIDPDFLREENHQSFSNFLARCASGLVKLTMEIPENGGSMAFHFPSADLTFPNLRELTLSFPYLQLQFEREEERFSSASSSVALPFIQSILTGSQKLKALNFVEFQRRESNIPRDIRTLSLPSTITALNVSSFRRGLELEALLSFDFPHLDSLCLRVSYESTTKKDLISQILEKFRSSLRCFEIRDGRDDSRAMTIADWTWPPYVIRFPLMEKMETLCFCSQYAEIEEGHSPLQNMLPNLKTLELFNKLVESHNGIWFWSESSTFPNVTTLTLFLVGDYSMSNQHTRMSNNFPCVSTLIVHTRNKARWVNLSPIYLEMPQLKTLEVHLYNHWHREEDYFRHEEWDPIFIGVPVETRNLPNWWPNYQRRNPEASSIANLKGLEKLVLLSAFTPSYLSYISDMVFHLAFLQMPNLKTLEFGGAFKASAEMAIIWSMRGCILREAVEQRRIKVFNRTWY